MQHHPLYVISDYRFIGLKTNLISNLVCGLSDNNKCIHNYLERESFDSTMRDNLTLSMTHKVPTYLYYNYLSRVTK